MRTYWLGLLSVMAVPQFLHAEDWPQFLGPNRDGVSKEVGLLDSLEGLKPPVWKSAGGEGLSAVVVSAGRVVTLAQDAESEFVICYDAKSGEEAWRVGIDEPYLNPQGDGPRATPAIEVGIVYAFSGAGKLVAVNLKTGDLLWKTDVIKELKGRVAEYGMASSPLIHGDHVIIFPGTPQGAVAAFKKDSGKLVWKVGTEKSSYCSPVVYKIGGQNQIIALTGSSALGISPLGQQLWRYPFETEFDCNIACPILIEGQLLLSAGEEHGSVLLDFPKPNAPKPSWESLGGKSLLKSAWQTPIVLDGHLYGWDNLGASGPITNLVCINLKTKSVVWEKKRFGKGGFLLADGKLICLNMDGELILVQATSEAYQELGRAEVFGPGFRNTPALSDGRLYFRDSESVYCLDLKK